jgi:hypothetical protein
MIACSCLEAANEIGDEKVLTILVAPKVGFNDHAHAPKGVAASSEATGHSNPRLHRGLLWSSTAASIFRHLFGGSGMPGTHRLTLDTELREAKCRHIDRTLIRLACQA